MKVPLPYLIPLLALLVTSCSLLRGTQAFNQENGFELPRAQKTKIARQIWQNEASGKVDGLVAWNDGEAFPSLGIGHFIWYPKGVQQPFAESFPAFIKFAKSRKPSAVPHWLFLCKDSPWTSQEQLLASQDSSEVRSLKQFLSKELALQMEFIIDRASASFDDVLKEVAKEERPALEAKYLALSKLSSGQYALLDYVNFKGEGTKLTERYQGQGWGLLQVLQAMELNEGVPANEAFSEAAKLTLQRRVKLSPADRNEQRWLAGWMARCETYKKAL